MSENTLAYRRTIVIFITIILLILSFLIVKPFLVAIIGAAVLAYLFYPLYRKILKAIPKFLPAESIASMLTVLIIILIVLMPMIVVSISLGDEVRGGYHFLQNVMQDPNFSFDLPKDLLSRFGSFEGTAKQAFFGVANQGITWLQNDLGKIPGTFLNILITVFSVYFFLKGGKNLFEFCQNVLPLPEGRYKQIQKRFEDISYGMIYGQIVVGIVQGCLAWIGFIFLNVPNPVLWGFITAIVSIVPMFGAAMVWFPVVIYLAIKGYAIGNYTSAIILLAYGALIISTIDNLLKPKLVGDRAKIHPLLILFGIIGGIQLIGLPGILIGPMILAMFDVAISMLREVI